MKLLAPNGKPTNLTPEQYKLVRTPEFKAWFGDWENSPENSSKVVDENGEPLICYYGGRTNINVFDNKKSGSTRIGIFTTDSRKVAKHYTEFRTKYMLKPEDINKNGHPYLGNKSGIYDFFVNIKKPLVIDAKENNWSQIPTPKILKINAKTLDTDTIVEMAKKMKYDGVLFSNIYEEGGLSNDYVALNSFQIKLADGSNTKFDGNNPDIRYADGGEVAERKETYKKWKSLVNMSKSELEKFYNSEEGKEAGLSASEAKEKGIDSGRESARWIMKMKDTPVSDWTPNMWRWAKKQISFISRMSGNKGGLYDDKGRKTRKHTSLLIWGNNPEKKKFDLGGTTMRKPKKIDINKMPTFIAPNGKRSNLYQKEEGKDGRWVYLYNIVRTPEFKSWFGDWEEAYRTKDYDGVSKIIDENGEPSVCYHVTSNEFFEFDENFIGSRTDGGYYGKGFYFTEGTPDSHYGQREIPCFLNIKNPLIYLAINRSYVLDTNELKDKGYDGVLVFPNYIDFEKIDLTKGLGYHGNRIEEIVAYYPEQIKIADTTNTTFDKYDNDIRFDDGGSITKHGITKIGNDIYISRDITKLPKDAIIVEHRYENKIKAGELGFFTGEVGQVDSGFGDNIAYVSIGNKAKIVTIYSSESYLDKNLKGKELEEFNEYILNKYRDNRGNHKHEDYKDFFSDAGILGNPSTAWYELEKKTIEMLEREHGKFDVLEMRREDELVPHQYLILNATDPDIRFKDGGTTMRKPKIKSKDSNSKKTVYHGGHDIGSELILRKGYYGGKKTGVDSGAIFFTPSIKYANQYLKHKDGLYKYELEVTDNIFDGTNENHYLRLKDGFIKNWQDEYSSIEDAISDYENAVNSIKSSLSYGAIDWATGSQFLEQISNSGFEGIKFLERPAENIETNSETGEYELSGNPVYSYALFKDEVKVDRFGNGGQIKDLLSSQEVANKLGRELHWWNDDIVYLSGIKYKKVYLRPEYKRVIE